LFKGLLRFLRKSAITCVRLLHRFSRESEFRTQVNRGLLVSSPNGSAAYSHRCWTTSKLDSSTALAHCCDSTLQDSMTSAKTVAASAQTGVAGMAPMLRWKLQRKGAKSAVGAIRPRRSSFLCVVNNTNVKTHLLRASLVNLNQLIYSCTAPK